MNIVLSVIICFFTAYGVFQLLYSFACIMTKGRGKIQRRVHRLVPVTDDAKDIEGYVRYLALRDNDENVILLNMAEDKDVLNIMRMLMAEFDFVYVMTPYEYAEYVTSEYM